MAEYFENHARQILTVLLRRRNPSLADVENLAAYLEAHFSNGSEKDDGASSDNKPAGRPRKGGLPDDLPIVVEVFGDREAELGLRQKLADECGFSKNTAKSRIEETRQALPEIFAEPKSRLAKIMADNGLSSLARKRDQQ